MSRRTTDVSARLVAGAALYWAAYAFRIMNPQAVYFAALGADAQIVCNLFMLATVVAIGLAMRRVGVRRMRVAVSACMVAASLAVLACDAVLSSAGLALSVLLAFLDFYTLGACMMLWGIAFASLERGLAARNVAMTVAVSVAVILAGQALGRDIPVAWLTDLFTAASGAIMLGGRVALRNQPRAPQPRPRAQASLLLAQRVACGLAIGLFPGALGALVARTFDPAVMVFCIGAAVALALYMARTGVGRPHHVLLAMLALTAPFVRDGETAMLGSLFASLWLSWQTISSVQLSDLKESLGTSEVDICLVDKVAIALSALTGITLCRAGGAALGIPLLPGPMSSLLVIVAMALVFMATRALAAIVEAREQDSLHARVAQAAEQREHMVFDAISREFGLSARERQVMEMLAQGYTGGFIADRLGITVGTVKAHAAHIYQKLGVHHKDQMLELVDDWSGRAVPGESGAR